MWVYCTGEVARPPPIVLFEYQPSRAGVHPKAFLEGAKNIYLHTDYSDTPEIPIFKGS
jgi:hypothetical protein